MKIHCTDCDWVGNDTEVLSGDEDEYGSRGVCPNCGTDDVEFAEANDSEIAKYANLHKFANLPVCLTKQK
ncbi:MAG: hypothetical protein Q7K26_02165 [bacterium]|nr:hypothetical protein [bacterium]